MSSFSRVAATVAWLCWSGFGLAAEVRYQQVAGHGGLLLNVVESGRQGAPGILFIHGFAQSYVAFKRQFDLIPMQPPPMNEQTQTIVKNSERSRSVDLNENLVAAKATGELLSTPNMTEEERRTAFAMQIMMPAYVRRLMRGRNLDNTDLVQHFQLPVLLIRGSDDMVMPEPGTRELMQKLPSGRLSTYPEAGHLPFFEEPQRFNRELRDFVAAQQE